MGIQSCRTCGAKFETHGRKPYRYCETHRISDAERRNQAARVRTKRRRAAISPALCRVCGASFLAMRSDSSACSPACKRAETNRRAREFDQRNKATCADCGVEIARRSTRCKPCADKVGAFSRRGERNVHWKGGRTVSKGYVYLLVDPEARKGHRYRAEHIVVWEKANGKPLPKGWVVHHKNGVKHDNRPENLEVMPRHKHNHRHDEHDRRIVELEAEVDRLRKLLNGSTRPQVPA
jgi:hypothetical protein